LLLKREFFGKRRQGFPKEGARKVVVFYLSSFALMQKNEKIKTGSFCLIFYIFLIESAIRLRRIAKKLQFLQENPLNSGGKSTSFCVHNFLPPLKQWGFLGIAN